MHEPFAQTQSSPAGCQQCGKRGNCQTAYRPDHGVRIGDAVQRDVKQAQQRVYDMARGIYFDGAQYRRDIGYRAVKGS